MLRVSPLLAGLSPNWIRERAYQIWIREGQPEGRELENWHQAEQELAEEDARAEHEHDDAGLAAAREYDRDAKELPNKH
jgi:hypothetical protein